MPFYIDTKNKFTLIKLVVMLGIVLYLVFRFANKSSNEVVFTASDLPKQPGNALVFVYKNNSWFMIYLNQPNRVSTKTDITSFLKKHKEISMVLLPSYFDSVASNRFIAEAIAENGLTVQFYFPGVDVKLSK
jgi:hypothetical protein